MNHPTRDLTKSWRKGDAQKLATLETEADVAWPGGGGWQTTAEEAERDIRHSDLLGAFITEDARRIISICTLNATPGQKEHAFIPHLNCHPDYHGKKHGKSVLLAAVEGAYRAGYQKVDLYTWPGNLKAVPLYKKCGFVWRPESSVRMENFTLAARRHPLGRRFFARHDWYQTQVRELALEEDLVERGKVKVYEYLWRAEDGEHLRMVFDRQSWRPIEIENQDLLVSCSLPDEKLVAGITHPIQWRVVNKRKKPVPVVLTASGDPGVQVDKQEVLEVTGDATVEGTFVLDPEMPEKIKDPKAAILHTSLTVGGAEAHLAAGAEAEQAARAWIDTPRSICRPGVTQDVVLALESNLDASCRATVSVSPASGIDVEKRVYRVVMKSRGGAEVRVPVVIPRTGPASLNVDVKSSYRGKAVRTKTQPIDVLAAEPGGCAAGVGDSVARLCGAGLAAQIGLKYGAISVFHTMRGKRARRMEIHRPQLGPPYSWQDVSGEKAEAFAEQGTDGATVCLRWKSLLWPGVVLERRISVDRSPLVKIADTVINGSARSHRLSLKQGWYTRGSGRSEVVVPNRKGVCRRESWNSGGRRLGELKLPDGGDDWPEGWACLESDNGTAAGMLWGRAERVRGGGRGEIERPVGTLGPGQSATLDPIYAYVGDGDWRAVRGWWQTLIGGGPPEEEPTSERTHRPIDLGVAPDPLLVRDGVANGRLFLRNVGERALDGELVLTPGPGLKSGFRSVQVKGLCDAKPINRRVAFTTPRRLMAGPVDLGVRFENEEAIYRSGGSALVLPRNPQDVTVTQDDSGEVFTIDNGILTARVAPGFRGSVISLVRDGKEYLSSAYPKARIRGWENPWHGGLHPHCEMIWGSLHREAFHGRIIRRKGRQGLVWHGVRVTCTVKQEAARGQNLQLDYLLAPGADVLAVLPTYRDRVGVQTRGQVGFWAHPAIAESVRRATFHSIPDSQNTTLAAPHWMQADDWSWGGLEGRGGRCLFVSAGRRGSVAGGVSMGKDGCFLYGDVHRDTPANGSVGGLFFVLPAGSLEEARAHSVWSEFDALP